MKRIIPAAFVLLYSFTTMAQEVVTHQIGDDGFVEVPLQFTFPYYGQVFTNSWMFDNGVVGFYSPFDGYNGGQNYFSQPFSAGLGGQFSYMIAPLWTDLLNYSGTFTTQGDSTFQRYTWNNISQWGYPDNLNTFSLEITPSGSISVEYDQISIQGYPVSTGTTGNLSQGEFEQIFYAGSNNTITTNSVSNWQTSTDAVDPCNDDPLSSPSCAGYQAALLELQCSADTLSNVNCPGYLEEFMANFNTSIEDIFINEISSIEIAEEDITEELIAEEEFSDEDEILDEDEIAEELIANEELIDEDEVLDIDEILDLLALLETLTGDNDKPIDSSNQDNSSVAENALSENADSSLGTLIARTGDSAESLLQENSIRVEVTQLVEQSVSSTITIAEIINQDETQAEDTLGQTIADEMNLLIAENDEEELQIATAIAITSSASSMNETNIESFLSDNTTQENNTEIAIVTEQGYTEEEITSESMLTQTETESEDTLQNIDFDVLIRIENSLDVASTATSVFNNNTMQQVLAMGGTITEILNTPVPDFSRFEIKPPTQDEEVQTARVENALESMSTEEIESQAELRIGSMDPVSQAIALQLIGYKPGFDQYGGTLVDQSNWYLDRGVYTNNRVPSSNTNLIFGAQDQRHQELMSLQYRR